MVVVSSVNGKVGMGRAMAVLREGGSAVDAVEAGTREVERIHLPVAFTSLWAIDCLLPRGRNVASAVPVSASD